MDIKYNMPYVKKSQMHIVYTQIHTKSVHTQLQSVQKTTICYIFKDNKYNITMCPIKKRFSSSHYLTIWLSHSCTLSCCYQAGNTSSCMILLCETPQLIPILLKMHRLLHGGSNKRREGRQMPIPRIVRACHAVSGSPLLNGGAGKIFRPPILLPSPHRVPPGPPSPLVATSRKWLLSEFVQSQFGEVRKAVWQQSHHHRLFHEFCHCLHSAARVTVPLWFF